MKRQGYDLIMRSGFYFKSMTTRKRCKETPVPIIQVPHPEMCQQGYILSEFTSFIEPPILA
jgi:hypothetical protein